MTQSSKEPAGTVGGNDPDGPGSPANAGPDPASVTPPQTAADPSPAGSARPVPGQQNPRPAAIAAQQAQRLAGGAARARPVPTVVPGPADQPGPAPRPAPRAVAAAGGGQAAARPAALAAARAAAANPVTANPVAANPGGTQPAPPHRPVAARAAAAEAPQPAPQPLPAPTVTPDPVPPPAAPARLRVRHWMLMLSFALVVLLPGMATAWYLWTRAADQYASTVGFSVRREETGSAIEFLGGITQLSGSSSSDTDILYEFLQSQKLVADLDAELDLRALWSRPENDPVFTFDPTGTIEDLVDYWPRMVRIYYDSGSGLIDIRVQAFSPEDATRIAEAIFRRSSDMINDLSAIAREDSIGYAREELAAAVERLKTAREAVTKFRNLNQLVDPTMDVQTQAGLLGTLQSQLAEALIDVDLMRDTAQDSDPRLIQAQRRVQVINQRIAAERRKLGMGSDKDVGEAFASVVGDYERLVVDREFAQSSYVAALATYDSALAEARRKSRYLAAHVLPTRAESARYPERVTLLGLVSLFLFLLWAIGALVAYALKDRR